MNKQLKLGLALLAGGGVVYLLQKLSWPASEHFSLGSPWKMLLVAVFLICMVAWPLLVFEGIVLTIIGVLDRKTHSKK